MMTYGLYDTQDHCWMGGDEGPWEFTDYALARIAAQVMDGSLAQEPGRTEAREYERGPKRLRERVDTVKTPLQALRDIEGGVI